MNWIFDGLLYICCAIAGMALGYLFGYLKGFEEGRDTVLPPTSKKEKEE